MKSFAVLSVVAGAAAQITTAPYITPYLNVGKSIDAQVKSLNSAVLAYSGGDASAAIADANNLLTAINSGAEAIPKLSSITDFFDALALLDTYQTALATDVGIVVKNLISKKALVNSNGICSTVSVLLKAESSAARRLADAVVAQLQDERVDGAEDIASGSVINPITSALDSGIAAYTSCPDSGPTTSSGPSTTSSGPTSSTNEPTSTSKSTTSPPGSTSGPGSTCTSTGYNSKQIKKCLKIISSAALAGKGGNGYGEL